jgi:Cu+-exporting ATPase
VLAGEALAAAAAIELASGHPLATAIRSEAQRTGLALPDVEPGSLVASAGGVRGRLAGGARGARGAASSGMMAGARASEVAVGSPEFLAAEGIDVATAAPIAERFRRRGWTLVLVALDGRARLLLGLADRIRPTSTRAVRVLHALGVQVEMTTGDHAAAGSAIAALAGIATVHAGESPARKAERVRALQAAGQRVGMVGDGTNDAPALAAADVGFAIGGATDLARDAATLVLVRGDLARVAVAVELARATLAVIRQNLALAFAYNLIALPAAALGRVSPPFAAAAMAASSLLVVGNALRLRRFRSRLETGFGLES